ncbi:MAG: N-acetylneuraminate synthase family protein [Candidatus Nealsonbacteria bacterium]|nr:N-acetylneuraminate synthase family protein [Candidatus Nealsonbacteria bacterium]
MSSKIILNDIIIGDEQPCLVVPDGCDNHMGSLERAKEMAYAAKISGAKIIKWQLHLPEEEMVKDEAIAASKEMLAKWGSIWDFVNKFRLSVDDHYQLKQYCDKIGIQYFCTPFSSRAAEILNQMGVYGFKIGSGETEDLLMIEEIVKMKRPMIISTGMSDLSEIDFIAQTIQNSGTPYAFAHCLSIYEGQKANQLNYGVISLFKKRYGVPVGLSDHTPPDFIKSISGIAVSHEARIWAAVHQGANFIEKHFTLDRKQADADSCFSLNPQDLKDIIETVKAAEEALGKERKVFNEEKPVAEWAKRSIVSLVDIPKGSIITREILTSKRPGTGIRSKDYKQIIGKRTRILIPKNTLIKWEQIQD